MRKLAGVLFGLGLALHPQFAAAYDHSGDPHWIRDSTSGCWIFNAFPDTDESIVWTGPRCAYDEEAQGEGTVTWFKYSAWTLAEKGVLENGRMSGEWIRRFANGNVENSYWVDGVKQQDTYADQGGDAPSESGDGSTYTPTYDSNAYMETLKRQNRENCERAAKGANIICNPE